MLKKIFSRSILGFPLGIAMGYAITIVISLWWGQGYYVSCVPTLVKQFDSEILAVIFQAVLCGILGSGFCSASVIWEIDRWSIAKRTFIHFIITSALMFPIAYIAHWIERSLKGFVIYFGIFALVFLFFWLVQYLIYKYSINSINKQICK